MPRRLHVFSMLTLLASSRLAFADSPTATPTTDERAAPEPRLTPPVLHALGLMSVMRVSEAYLWPHPFAETDLTTLALRYDEAFSRPPKWDSSRAWYTADGDRWQINIVGHGLFGSELYLRARTCHLPAWRALLFTGLASATWEYGVEASGVRPSALDLTYTPLAGLVVGEARFQGYRAAQRLEPGALRTSLFLLFDPLGELERGLGSPC